MTLLTFGVAGARAAGALGSGPAVGVDPANHAQVVFWRGASGDILETYYYTHWRGPVDVTKRYGLGPTSAAPAVAVAGDDQQYLFWRGAGGHIHEGHHTTRWTSYSFRSWGTATSAPAVAVDPKTNHQYVFWRGRDGQIHEAWYAGRWHCCRDFAGWGKTAWAPAVSVASDEQQYVFWGMPGGFVREAHHTSRWMPVRTFHSWRTIDTPTVAVDPVTSAQSVFWRNINDDIVYSRYPDHGWWSSPQVMASWPRAAGSPSAAISDDGQADVFWQTSAGSVQEAHHTTSWKLYSFPGWKPASSPPPSQVPYCAAKDLGIHLEKTSGAAGSEYRDFGFVNVSSHACELHGYPGVSAVTISGSVFDFRVTHRANQPEHTVVIAPGADASFSLAVRQVSSPCRRFTRLRFIPPNDRQYEQIALGFTACGGRVSVSPVQSQPPPI